MSPLAENSRGLGAYQVLPQFVEKIVLKDETIAECLVVFSQVPMIKHEVKQRLIDPKQLFVS